MCEKFSVKADSIHLFFFIFFLRGYTDMKTREHVNDDEVNETNARTTFIQITWYFRLLNAFQNL